MLKETGEIVKAIFDFLRSPRLMATVLISSGIWLIPGISFPVHGNVKDTVELIASVLFTLSAASLLISTLLEVYMLINRELASPARRYRKALHRATANEKIVLCAVVHKGYWEVRLDVGSEIAMHLQEIGLIEKAFGFPHTTYQLAPGLAELCIKKPALLRVTEDEEEVALSEMLEWKESGLHQGFFYQLAGQGRDAWMS